MTQNPIIPVSRPRHDDRTSRTDDEHVVDMVLLPPPEHLIRFFPVQGTPVEALVAGTRSRIRNILRGTDDRLLVVVGPCSIHDPAAALDYARHLAVERDRASDTLEIVMRVYFEKPRTTVGWKGLINDPHMDDSFHIEKGIRVARELLLHLADIGMPAATEALDPIMPQYLSELITWTAVAAVILSVVVHGVTAGPLNRWLSANVLNPG
jgi:3-deoxy-7-phosphoheptulonate synthase